MEKVLYSKEQFDVICNMIKSIDIQDVILALSLLENIDDDELKVRDFKKIVKAFGSARVVYRFTKISITNPDHIYKHVFVNLHNKYRRLWNDSKDVQKQIYMKTKKEGNGKNNSRSR